MKLWMSKSSYTSGYDFWHNQPRPLPKMRDGKLIDLMYCDGGERLCGNILVDELFPSLSLGTAGCCQVETLEIDGGYTIRRVRDDNEAAANTKAELGDISAKRNDSKLGSDEQGRLDE